MRAWLTRPIDSSGLSAFRVLFGLVLAGGAVRTLASGWIEKLYVEPRFFFTYWGFSWVRPWPGVGMYLHFGALAWLAACVAVGFHTRVATLLFTLGFAYAHLIDKTNYLNHYFLVVFMGLLGTVLPWDRAASVDAWRKGWATCTPASAGPWNGTRWRPRRCCWPRRPDAPYRSTASAAGSTRRSSTPRSPPRTS